MTASPTAVGAIVAIGAALNAGLRRTLCVPAADVVRARGRRVPLQYHRAHQ
jgi:hypothetical protein